MKCTATIKSRACLLRVNRYVNFKPKGPLCPLCGDAEAADLWVGGYAPPGEVEVFCSSCIRDGVYGDTKLIAHLEANPDIDEAFQGPIILAARADVHRLRKILGPGERISAAPCCYFRKRLYVR